MKLFILKYDSKNMNNSCVEPVNLPTNINDNDENFDLTDNMIRCNNKYHNNKLDI